MTGRQATEAVTGVERMLTALCQSCQFFPLAAPLLAAIARAISVLMAWR